MLTSGDRFPDFTLTDESGHAVGASDLAGSWYLLYWYPKADTPGCTAQAEGLRDQLESFDELGCVVLGASFDPPEDNAAFKHKYRLPFTLLSDIDRSLARRVGAASESPDADNPYAARVAHLVDPHGLIRAAFVVDDPGQFADLVLDTLEELTD